MKSTILNRKCRKCSFFLYSFCSFCLFCIIFAFFSVFFTACAVLIHPCEAARCKKTLKKAKLILLSGSLEEADTETHVNSFTLQTSHFRNDIFMDFNGLPFVCAAKRAVMESFPLLGVRYKPKVFPDPRQRSNMTARVSDHITYICLNTVIFMQESGSPVSL